VTQPTDNADTAKLMAERYGATSRSGRGLAVVAIAFVALVALCWVLWAAWHQATGTVSGSVSAYNVVAEHRVDVTVQIHRPAHHAAQCTVQAQASDHSVVGQTVVSLPAAGSSDVQVTRTIRTDGEATTAIVSECH
jgi:cytochrome c-type biogenesis protein CcmH/NrfG